MTAASIRTKNPGAMWPGPVATKFGSKRYENLADGQGNKIAVFDTFEDGCAAEFYLWRTKYAGLTLAAAIRKWSGGNSPTGYAQKLSAACGLQMADIITPAFLAGPKGIEFMKVQSAWEAGSPYPATEGDWQRGQARAFGAPNRLPVPVSKHAVTVMAAGSTAVAAHGYGLSPWVVAIAVLVVGGVVYWAIKRWG